MLFVFTVSSFCTSAPEEREEKPRNRAFGYVAKSDALSRQRRRRLPVAVPSRKKPSRRAPKKSTWGFSERDDTRLRAQMRTEANRRGEEPRSGRKPSSGDREKGQGPRGQKVRRKRSDALQAASARRVEAEVALDFRESHGHQANGAAPPQRRLGDIRRPTCAHAAANLGVPLPQQVRCRGAHRATNARLAERAQA